MGEITVRPRRAADLAPLADVLFAQQPTSHYPVRNPLPFPVERFLHADDASAAWTAEYGGRPVGHVCWTGPAAGSPDDDAVNAACAAAHDCAVDRLAWVRTLFTGLDVRGLGVGRQLLATVVADIRAAGRRPCLEVLPVHPAALELYRASGWVAVHSLRPEWLRGAVGDDGPDVTVMVLPEDVTPDR
ncbi:hypothetical protein GCM10022237_19280 [Nocardioides ginsengisoli]|uniref:N-acetyltransferase family protein n=1 Tax=Nocardioides ginsengisoli TaxID=363868 RepID=A0ABW3W7Y4_9ACTN